jgi:hypothetical protein
MMTRQLQTSALALSLGLPWLAPVQTAVPPQSPVPPAISSRMITIAPAGSYLGIGLARKRRSQSDGAAIEGIIPGNLEFFLDRYRLVVVQLGKGPVIRNNPEETLVGWLRRSKGGEGLTYTGLKPEVKLKCRLN